MSMKIFGERLKAIIKEKGSSQKELAAKLDKDDQTVSRWVNGETAPDAFDIIKIIEILNIKASELFGEVSKSDKLEPEIFEIIDDPVFRKVIMPAFKNKKDVKNAVLGILECLPSLTPEKRQAILALCK